MNTLPGGLELTFPGFVESRTEAKESMRQFHFRARRNSRAEDVDDDDELETVSKIRAGASSGTASTTGAGPGRTIELQIYRGVLYPARMIKTGERNLSSRSEQSTNSDSTHNAVSVAAGERRKVEYQVQNEILNLERIGVVKVYYFNIVGLRRKRLCHLMTIHSQLMNPSK